MTDSSSEPSSARANGPGRLLRQARENAKLSLEDLAAQLKLSRHTLDALERDDFGTLKEPVYIRGYYRKLSRVLGIPEGELIAAYDGVPQPRAAAAAPSKLILAGDRDLGTQRPWSRALVFLVMVVVAVLIALAAFWATRRNPLDVADTATSAPAGQGSGAEAVAVEVPTSTSIPTPTVPPSTPPPAAATVTTGGVTAPTGAASATTTAVGVADLGLDYSKDCWTRVDDSDGKTLISRIVAAGERLSYQGKPPFTVSLGHAPGVQMRFNGTPVDMSGFTKSNGTARFSLP